MTTELEPAGPYRFCPACEVWWIYADACWICEGTDFEASHIGPVILSQVGHATAMSDDQWTEVRRQIGA